MRYLLFAGLILCAEPKPERVDVRELTYLEQVPVRVDHGHAIVDFPAQATDRQYLLVLGAASAQPPGVQAVVRARPLQNPGPLLTDYPVEDPFWKNFARSRQWQMQIRRTLEERPSRHETARFAPQRSFYIFTGEDNFHDVDSYQEVQATLVAVGKHCLVYVDVEDMRSGFPTATADFVVDTFDKQIYPKTSKIFGNHRDVDRNGRFTILFTQLLNKLSNGKVSLGGFVRGGDFYRDVEAPFSNRCDMMYLNSNIAPGDYLQTLLAHEYTHAITFSEHVFGRYLIDGTQADEQSWLSEAISHLAENAAGSGWSNLDYRISTFLSAPYRYRLVVPDYYREGLWRCHGSRGSTYLFLRWCVDQYGQGLLKEITQSNLTGTTNIEVAAQKPFRELFRSWCVSMCLAGLQADGELQKSKLPELSLYGPLERRFLAGVRYETLQEEGSVAIRLSPTSFCPVRIHIPAGRQTRVEIEIPEIALPQVTLVRLMDDLPRVRLQVEPESYDEQGSTVRLQLVHESGAAVHWETLTWELETLPQTTSDVDYKRANIQQWDEVFSSNVSCAGDALKVALPNLDEPESYVFKAFGRDSSGRPVTAWGQYTPIITQWVRQ